MKNWIMLIALFTPLAYSQDSALSQRCSELQKNEQILDRSNLAKKACENFEGQWHSQNLQNKQVSISIVELENNDITQIRNKRTKYEISLQTSDRNSDTSAEAAVTSFSGPHIFELSQNVTLPKTSQTETESVYSSCKNGEALTLYFCSNDVVVQQWSLKMKVINQVPEHPLAYLPITYDLVGTLKVYEPAASSDSSKSTVLEYPVEKIKNL